MSEPISDATPVLAASHVTKQFRVAGGHLTAVDDVSVEFHQGKVLAVVGESGSGKSTLARCCCG